uniref:Uncharacterized protein n=1 Tax=Rhizophora mucronata TaxID=61149 RepID=A0A2P2NAD1_RHIMU
MLVLGLTSQRLHAVLRM